MSQDTRGGGHRAAGRRRRKQPVRRKALTIAAWSAAGVVLLGGGSLGYFYFKLNGNLKTVDINQALGTDRPQNADNGSMDILVLGSDSRGGANGEYGQDDGGSARSDTAMIVHLYDGHKKASVVSIPRDALVTRPSCAVTGSKKTDPGGPRHMFNESFTIGGAACAVKTVEKMSGIRMDHYMEVDFTGFKKIIDNLGGVEVTTTKPIKDGASHLDLASGTNHLNGEQALGLVRTRKSVGDGSDLGRIQLQQAFIKALIKQVKSIGIFDNPKRLVDLADTSTKALTTDTQLGNVKALAGFAQSLQGIDAQNMQMITLPVGADVRDPDRVVPLTKESKMVWDALLAEQSIPAEATANSMGDKGKAGEIVR
ncbi:MULTISPECIES: LCP family protein [unclassified Streptomyces]|uniref:LCP family protein n=1 Tax=unclassified Streptomyces TaxID=2593676 RepID=UPI001BE8029F|nr:MULTISPECIES: LCP family protein [unclassified Streptomyces]MBT2403873.1 LCP family protein [Streptomyces sp. ISL-21]MBT2613126.1 LCP family protein [Streptomyces sp. ISL-87]